MVKKVRNIRRRRAIKPVEDEVEDEEVLEEDDDVVDEEDDVDEDADDVDEEDDDASAAKAPVRRTTKSVPAAVKEVAEEVAAEFNFAQLLESMANGDALLIVRKSSSRWTAQRTEATALQNGGPRLRGKEYWETVLSPEFQDWQKQWEGLSDTEKIKAAKKAKATWVEHEDPKVNIMRAGPAYRKVMKIEKYKPEYQKAAARRALKG